MKKIKFASLLLALALLISALAMTVAADGNQLITNEQILEAAQPLISAEAEYYNISSVTVQNVAEEANTDGTMNVNCDLVFTMCLKAENVEDLPYVAGLLDGIDMASMTECVEAGQIAVSAATNVAGPSISLTEEAVVAKQAADFMANVAENIGTSIELTFSVVLNVAADGTVNGIYGLGDNGSFPLSDYFPASDTEMYQNGLNHASSIQASASEIAADINAATLIVYYRVDARNYANLYTSNATTTYNGSGTYMNPSYYNSAYTFFKDADCANFISQAIRYGGIPINSTWQPYTYAWVNAEGLRAYLKSSGLVEVSNYTSCNAGGIICCIDSEDGLNDHIVMCVLNDTVNRAYSAHTSDCKAKAYTSSYPNWTDHYAEYLVFKVTSTESQYDDGLLD